MIRGAIAALFASVCLTASPSLAQSRAPSITHAHVFERASSALSSFGVASATNGHATIIASPRAQAPMLVRVTQRAIVRPARAELLVLGALFLLATPTLAMTGGLDLLARSWTAVIWADLLPALLQLGFVPLTAATGTLLLYFGVERRDTVTEILPNRSSDGAPRAWSATVFSARF